MGSDRVGLLHTEEVKVFEGERLSVVKCLSDIALESDSALGLAEVEDSLQVKVGYIAWEQLEVSKSVSDVDLGRNGADHQANQEEVS